MSMGLEWDGWHQRNRAGGLFASSLPALVDDVRHGLDLRDLFGESAQRWPAPWARETVRQVHDDLLCLEQAIVLHLQERPFDQLAAQMPPGFTAPLLARNPALLSPALLRHMRQRAALVLSTQSAGQTGMPMSAPAKPLSGLLAALAQAELAWQPAPPGAGPAGEWNARADLPAEGYGELAWTAAALIAWSLERSLGGASPAAVRAVARACEAVLARYDEGQGALAIAIRAARLVDEDARPALASQALVEGRLLFFAGLAAVATGMALEDALDRLLDGATRDRMALLRLAGATDEAAVAFFAQWQALHGADDATADPARLSDLYRDFSIQDAKGWLARQIGPPPMTLRLSLLDRSGG